MSTENTAPEPSPILEEAPHVLVVRIDTDGWPSVRVECPHDSIDRPCGTWIQKATGDSCTCDCDACLAGNHDGCDSDYVADVGRQHCQCEPINQCWFDHAAMEVGLEVFRLPKDGVTFRVAAHMSGHGWDDPIDVDPMPS